MVRIRVVGLDHRPSLEFRSKTRTGVSECAQLRPETVLAG